MSPAEVSHPEKDGWTCSEGGLVKDPALHLRAGVPSAVEVGRLPVVRAPALHPGDMQDRGDLFRSEEGEGWVECLDEAIRDTSAEKARPDLSRFEGAGAFEWWTEMPVPHPRAAVTSFISLTQGPPSRGPFAFLETHHG